MPTKPEVELLAALYRTLEDRPPEPDDAFYVGFLAEGSGSASEDPIAELATRIEFSESSSVSLLYGQRGSGKSTDAAARRSGSGTPCRCAFVDSARRRSTNAMCRPSRPAPSGATLPRAQQGGRRKAWSSASPTRSRRSAPR